MGIMGGIQGAVAGAEASGGRRTEAISREVAERGSMAWGGCHRAQPGGGTPPGTRQLP